MIGAIPSTMDSVAKTSGTPTAWGIIALMGLSTLCSIQAASEQTSRTESLLEPDRKPTLDQDRIRDDFAGTQIEIAEVILATLENKLRRVENLDRAIQHLIRKVDGLGDKMDGCSKGVQDQWRENVKHNAEQFAKVTQKLNNLAKKFDSVCEEDAEALQEDFIALPSNHQPRTIHLGERVFFRGDGRAGLGRSEPSLRSSAVAQDPLVHALDDVKDTVHGMDRRLAFHINIVSENLGKMNTVIQEVHQAVSPSDSDGPKTDSSFGGLGRRKFIRARNGTFVAAGLNVEGDHGIGIAAQIKPLEQVMLNVQQGMQGLQGLLVHTKGAIDDLGPRSDEQFQQSQQQERSLLRGQDELNMKADVILQNLSKVDKRFDGAQRPLLAETDPSQDLGFSNANDLDLSESASAYVTTTFVDGTARGNPYALDVDFSNGPTSEFQPHRQDREAAPFYPSNGPSVIFPSVENKPVVVNSTFTYDSGRNLGDAKGYSCADLQAKGLHEDGVYYLQIDGTRFWYMKVFCDMTSSLGGWTVIQRRHDVDEPRENFNRDWEEYKYGFGQPSREFWLGNENIYLLTKSQDFELRIELEDFDGNMRYAEYRNFRLGSEKEHYRLEIGGYHGNAGDSLNDPWYGSNLRPFSTFDRDNDRSSLNCASMLKGGWWWKSCGRGLNGLYLNDPQDLTARQGIVWFRWKGWDYSLKSSRMMIRPRQFRTSDRVSPETNPT